MKDKIYFICYFCSLIRFAHFMIMVGEELPSLPRLTARHWFFIIQIFEQLSGPEKQSPWNFPLCWNIFYLSGLLSNLCLPWKTECALNSLYWIYIYLTIQNFEQHALSLENIVCPEIFHYVEIFFIFQDFWETLRLPWKEFVMKFLTVFKILVTFRMYEQLVLVLKNSVPWIHCVEYIFHHPEFWTTCACPETIFHEIFHCIEIFFIFQNLSNLSCPETADPRLVRHWSDSLNYWVLISPNKRLRLKTGNANAKLHAHLHNLLCFQRQKNKLVTFA